jgi:hypothetical protein
MISYSLDKRIIIVNGISLTFLNDIRQVLDVDDIIIVRVWNNTTGDIQKQPFNNIYAINQESKVIWNIKDIVIDDGIYANICLDEFKRLVANEFIGKRFVIDIRTKKIISDYAYK